MKKWIRMITIALAGIGAVARAEEQLWRTYRGEQGPGVGRRVVLISGDEEYRSEEALPQLGRILAERHGFESIVLFAQDPAHPGRIDPNYRQNIPGLENLREADLMIIATRFRELPDEQMREIEAYLKSGRPVIGLRTATHAFRFPEDSPWAHWSFNYQGEHEAWHGGFGKRVLGETWVSHHGHHKFESTRGLLGQPHPITTAIDDGAIWSPADVYTINLPLPTGSSTLVYGQVLTGMSPSDGPVGPGPYEHAPRLLRDNPDFGKNDPMMPIAWTKPYQLPDGEPGRAFVTTQGASTDLADAAFRRLLVQAAYWCLDLPIPADGCDARLVGDYRPSMFGFHRKEGYWQQQNLRVRPPAVAARAPASGEHLAIIGNGLGERMLYFPYFETEIQSRFPAAEVVVRNLSASGDTPGFRPRAGRSDPWAFPGAGEFHPDLQTHLGQGHYRSPDEWLTKVGADTVVAFFGFNESFGGDERLADFEGELTAFIRHTREQRYNGGAAPRLVLVSPVAFENLSAQQDLPDGREENRRLAAYTAAMQRVAQAEEVEFVDVFHPSLARYEAMDAPQTINGFSLTDAGYRWLGAQLADAIYGPGDPAPGVDPGEVMAAVKDKDWYWRNDYAVLNGVHVYGRRFKPYGDVNYPEELEKIDQMTSLRDGAIHRVAQGQADGAAVDDSQTRTLTPIETNFNRPIEFLNVDKALEKFHLPDGYAIDLFASESEFPDLRNPVQISFDNRGRLWVAVAPSYPHYRPGAERPDDKLLILEDTDGDGRADRQTVFADGLHLPFGFELAPEGVYLAQQPNLVLLVDDDGDDHADRTELLLHGFDPHDTHHAISAFEADASGAFYMSEGRFLHSQVETPYGPQRCTDGGVWRFDPKSWRLERFMQTDVHNPWGLVFDPWGQAFLSDASNGANWWSLPLSAKIGHGLEIDKVGEFTTHRVRPTAGNEFIYSRHFPDDVQGDFLVNNTIGFLGTKEHVFREDGAGFSGELRQDLVSSTDPNFRPVDLEFAPDGSLYIVDWHNPLIGHMQHSARDPNRDHDHGRIYRVTYPSRPLVEPAQIVGAPVPALLDLLEEPELRTRYSTRRELRGRPADVVLPAVKVWVDGLDAADPDHERHLLEALWVTWGQKRVDAGLLERCLTSPRHECRAGAVQVLRYTYRQVPDAAEKFLRAASDPHPRVRLAAVVGSSWMENEAAAKVFLAALQQPVTHWLGYAYEAVGRTLRPEITALVESRELDSTTNTVAVRFLSGAIDPAAELRAANRQKVAPLTNMSADVSKAFFRGREIYSRDGHCVTCHAENGRGAVANVYPPLRGSRWIKGDPERMLKIMLLGMWGKIEVAGKTYDPSNGVPPMTAFGGILSDEEIADVATYVRLNFGSDKSIATKITAEQVKAVRAEVGDRTEFYTPEELLQQHPLPRE